MATPTIPALCPSDAARWQLFYKTSIRAGDSAETAIRNADYGVLALRTRIDAGMKKDPGAWEHGA